MSHDEEIEGNPVSSGDEGREKDISVQRMRTETIPVDMLEIGDVVRVLAGSSPPSDGTIVSEEVTAFDESSLTGESMPVTKEKGDQVFAGTINQGSPVSVRVEVCNGETM